MNFYTVSQTSLVHSSFGVVEMYIPLWAADGTYASTSTTTGATAFLCDGSSSTGSSTTSSVKLHTLNLNWNPSQKFAFEATFCMQVNGSGTAYAQLYDFSTSSVIATVSNGSSTMSVIRSNQFALTPGHQYGVAIYIVNSTGNINISDASLVVFGS